jgi:hypothetical protein
MEDSKLEPSVLGIPVTEEAIPGTDAHNEWMKKREAADKFIRKKIRDYAEIYDEDLWNVLRDDSNEWKYADSTPLRSLIKLREHLRNNGILIPRVADVREALRNIDWGGPLPEWTNNDILEHVQYGGHFNSIRLEIRFKELIKNGKISEKKSEGSLHFSEMEIDDSESPIRRQERQYTKPTAHRQSEKRQAQATATAESLQQPPSPTPPRFHQDHYDFDQSYGRYGQARQPAAEDDIRSVNTAIAQMIKIYTESSKYGGSEDSFTLKYRTFEDYCRRCGLPNSDTARQRAFPIMLKGRAEEYYQENYPIWEEQGISPRRAIMAWFEGPQQRRAAQDEWNRTTFNSIRNDNPEKPLKECLNILFTTLAKLRFKLPENLRDEGTFYNKLREATRLHKACRTAHIRAATTSAAFMEDLRSSVSDYQDLQQSIAQSNMTEGEEPETFYTDRRFHNVNRRGRFGGRQRYLNTNRRFVKPGDGICFICGKPGHHSTQHTQEERDRHREEGYRRFVKYREQYMSEYEGPAPKSNNLDSEPDNDEEEVIHEALFSQYDELKESKFSTAFFTTGGITYDSFCAEITKDLENRAAAHIAQSILTPMSSDFTPPEMKPSSQLEADIPIKLNPTFNTFMSEQRYDDATFQGILVDSGAGGFSTAGHAQYLAYQKVARDAVIDTSTAGKVEIRFGNGDPVRSLGSVDVRTPIGNVNFHILKTPTPFLMCLQDMDRLGIYLDNTRNVMVEKSTGRETPVIRRYGHLFLVWDDTFRTYIIESFNENPCFLTEVELRRLHQRFGHPSSDRLTKLLERAGKDVDKDILEHIRKHCHHCQVMNKSPGRFRFTLRDDVNFNHSIIVDIMFMEGRPVLHIIDEATRFNAARWLPNMSAKITWDVLQMAWIDSYNGPPDFITADAGKNFTSREFKHLAASIGSIAITVPVEAHWSIGAVERYHAVLRRAYLILKQELTDVSSDALLQMAVKAVNDTAGPDGLVPTLLVFGAYPKISEYDPPAPSVQERAAAIRKAMIEVRKAHAERQVNDALNTRNGPTSTAVHRLPLNSDVLVWREGKTGYAGAWKGPHTLLSVDGESCVVQLSSGPTTFRTTSVKPYFNDTVSKEQETVSQTQGASALQAQKLPPPPNVVIPPYRPHAYVNMSFNRIPEHQFAESRRKEMNGLLERGIFEPVDKADVPPGTRIFTLRFVDEVKNPGTDKAFEKSRLVVRAFNDEEKDIVLTESPTIQRCSQRLILCLAACKDNTDIYLRDVTQAYTQSETLLNRDFYVRPPPELQEALDSDIVKVVRPLYGIPEAGNHWFRTYHKHHVNRLGMMTSTFDPCLLHCVNPEQGFGIIGMQTDDTLILADNIFADREESEIRDAGIMCKSREKLTHDRVLKFNGVHISKSRQGILLNQELTCQKIRTIKDHNVDITSTRGKVRKAGTPKEQYVSQRALGAYVASMSQPEAAFALSHAAQTTTPGKEDTKALNDCLTWQQKNAARGLKYVKLDLSTLRLVTFVDASFANNKDLTSQIGFVIVLADAKNNANVVHWSSIKCRRVTRSVLASELYAMSHGFDAAAAIKSSITQLLHLADPLPLVMCTDSKSLYDCLVKLGTTQEKRLMIDLMSLRQSYERQEITEVRWISGESNPADAMTKARPCRALQALIDTNMLHIEATAWVERTPAPPLPEKESGTMG